jgi:protein-tyrosine phosphatase
MVRVLFVCLGNICRSPLAEGIFNKAVAQRGLKHKIECDSAGTSGYHIGEPPDPRAKEVAASHGIFLRHTGRQIRAGDLSDFDYVVAMDAENYDNIRRIAGFEKMTPSKLVMMRDFDSVGVGDDVPDPYYGGPDGFEHVYRLLVRSCNGLLDHIIEEHALTTQT